MFLQRLPPKGSPAAAVSGLYLFVNLDNKITLDRSVIDVSKKTRTIKAWAVFLEYRPPHGVNARGDPMNNRTIKVRLMKADDFDAVVGIDEKVLNTARREYYEMKFEMLFKTSDYIPASLVAEQEDGTVVGFVMGTTYMGEFGIFQEQASLDTIGVDPDCQQKGIGKQLIDEFVDHLRSLGVKKVNTLVDKGDLSLTRFFASNKFTPSATINLERSL